VNVPAAHSAGPRSHDFAARSRSGVDPSLVAGAEVNGQFRARDPFSPSATSSSDVPQPVIAP